MALDNGLKGILEIEQELDELGLSQHGYMGKLNDYLQHLVGSDEYEEQTKVSVMMMLTEPRLPCRICGRKANTPFSFRSFVVGVILVGIVALVLGVIF